MQRQEFKVIHVADESLLTEKLTKYGNEGFYLHIVTTSVTPFSSPNTVWFTAIMMRLVNSEATL